MQVIDRSSALWRYLSPEVRDLIEDGEMVLTFVYENKERGEISDFSFLVFPFAKAYEGFLKKFFLDLGLIKDEEYFSDEIRIGRILNPHFTHEKENVFGKVCEGKVEKGKRSSSYISARLWSVWKRGRNLVFHYFPHNYRKLSYNQALDIINDIIGAMTLATTKCKVYPS